jgi:hypothetical protein
LDVDAAGQEFLRVISEGPVFVCTSCKRCLYKNNVVVFSEQNYTNVDAEITDKVFSPTLRYRHPASDAEYVCMACHNAVKRGKIPAMSSANELQLDDIPEELHNLGKVEKIMLQKNISFMKIVTVRKGQQKKIQGPAVQVPADMTKVTSILPRLPKEASIIPVKVKRKLVYKGHVAHEPVRPNAVIAGLSWLKGNNPHYADVKLNENWENDCLEQDPELWNLLLQRCDEDMVPCVDNDHDEDIVDDDDTDTDVGQDNNGNQNSHHSNVSLSVVENIEQMTDIIDGEKTIASFADPAIEQNWILARANAKRAGFVIKDVPRDGDCLFHCFAYLLRAQNAKHLRAQVVQYLEDNPIGKDFMSDENDINDGRDAIVDNDNDAIVDNDNTWLTVRKRKSSSVSALRLKTRITETPAAVQQKRWNAYLQSLREGGWGDEFVLTAIMEMYQVKVRVITATSDREWGARNASANMHVVNLLLISQHHYMILLDPNASIPILHSNVHFSDRDRHDEWKALNDHVSNKGLLLQNMPRNGDALYHCIASELNSLSAAQLRSNVVTFLGEHSTEYGVQSVADEVAWQRKLDILAIGGFPDADALDALLKLCKIQIRILTQHSDCVKMPNNVPQAKTVTVALLSGLYYFNVLAKSKEQHDLEDDQDALDRAIELRGMPFDTCIQNENGDISDKILNIAPCEGNKPVPFIDDNVEYHMNPDKFPLGRGGFNTPNRPTKLSVKQYFLRQLTNVDNRFAKDIDYLFTAQYVAESMEMDSQISIAMRQTTGRRHRDMQINVGEVRNADRLKEMLARDEAFLCKFMHTVRGSCMYFQRLTYDVLAMIRQFGPATWFLTLSSADLQWPDVIQALARQRGLSLTEQEVQELSWQQRNDLLAQNPVTAARHFEYRVMKFFGTFLKSTANPIGKITHYVIRTEFQQRGSPHVHCLIWVAGAPRPGIDSDEDVVAFIDKYQKCDFPSNDEQLCDLVKQLQVHKHSQTCRKTGTGMCRFGFPKPPSPSTLIARELDDDDIDKAQRVKQAQAILQAMHTVLHENQDIQLIHELLVKMQVPEEALCDSLRIAKRGSAVVLKRQPNEVNVNFYNPHILRYWKANHDLQYVSDTYALVVYVTSYMTKAERSQSEMLRSIAAANVGKDLRLRMRELASAFLTSREVSAQESAYRILRIPFKHLSNGVLFVSNAPKDQRTSMLKPASQLADMDENDTEVFFKSIHDKYASRPETLADWCLADFCAWYTYGRTHLPDEDDVEDVNDDIPDDNVDLNIAEESVLVGPDRITLRDNLGVMRKRKKPLVIRTHKVKLSADPHLYYYGRLLLYWPWRQENDIGRGFQSCHDHHESVLDVVTRNEKRHTFAIDDGIERAMEYLAQNGRPEHAWDQLAPAIEQDNLDVVEGGQDVERDIDADDVNEARNLVERRPVGAAPANAALEHDPNMMTLEEYRDAMSKLNLKQKQIVLLNRKWCKCVVLASKQGKINSVEPYRVFLSGSGGCGKSFVIRLIYYEAMKILRKACYSAVDPYLTNADFKPVLLTATTGVAAFNIDGVTYHSGLGINPGNEETGLGEEHAQRLRNKLAGLKLLIIDEVSMLSAEALLLVHQRLKKIMGTPDDAHFARVSILAVGDLYQLRPVQGNYVFQPVRNSVASLFGSLWEAHFKLHELSQAMRQQDGSQFAELLNRIRVGVKTEEDMAVLQSREISPSDTAYPHDALHVFFRNKDVQSFNDAKLDDLAEQGSELVLLPALSSKKDINTHQAIVPNSSRGRPNDLRLAVSAKVMLTYNIDVSDGLMNGSRGVIVGFKPSIQHVTHVLVRFDNERVGKKAAAKSPYKVEFPDCVPIERMSASYGKKDMQHKATIQFPLLLAWASTIHKVQGETRDAIVVNMKGTFMPAMAYVAFSRVRTLEGLHIVNFDAKKIKACKKVHDAMNNMRETAIKPISPVGDVMLLPSNTYIRICHLNLNGGYRQKLGYMKAHGVFEYADIVCFNETWLLNDSHLNVVTDVVIPDCAAYRRERTHRGGGIMICVKQNGVENMHSEELILDNIDIECCGALVQCGESRLNVVSVYRAPNTLSRVAFVTQLQVLVETLHAANGYPILIIGDVNDDALLTQEMPDMMSQIGFSQYVTEPTFIEASLIDHVYFNGNRNILTEVVDCSYSDHDIVTVAIEK